MHDIQQEIITTKQDKNDNNITVYNMNCNSNK